MRTTSIRRHAGTAPGHRRPLARALALGSVLLLAALVFGAAGAQAQFWFRDRPMPEFTNQSPQLWINSKPLQKKDLRGKVVLIEIWTSI